MTCTEYHKVFQTKDGVWECAYCGDKFISGVEGIPVKTMELALESVASTMSAVLWDLQERTLEKYGVEPGEVQDDAEDCDEIGHDFDQHGLCTRCGHSPFLGNNS